MVNRRHSMLMGVVSVFASTSLALGAQLSVDSAHAVASSSVSVSVNLQSQGDAVTALQFDLSYDSTWTISATLGNAAETAGKVLYSALLPPSRSNPTRGANLRRIPTPRHLRILLAGLNQLPLADGQVVTITATASPSAATGAYPLTLTNLSASDLYANALAVSGVAGSLIVDTTTASTLIRFGSSVPETNDLWSGTHLVPIRREVVAPDAKSE